MKTELLYGDCLDLMKDLPDGSIDCVITDPPYGTVNGIAATEGISHGMKGKTSWDSALNSEHIFKECLRILRPNGALILFSQEPYTSNLITNAIPALPFSYRLVWVKDHFANALLAKKAPVSFYEDICVFFKTHNKHDFKGEHPLREYVKQIINFTGMTKLGIEKTLGHTKADHFLRVNSSQFALCTEKTYSQLVDNFKLKNMEGYLTFSDMTEINNNYRSALVRSMTEQHPKIFNLPNGSKFKSNILEYKKDYTGLHPTQKPVALIEDLILTYSNTGHTILDFTMGSGTTGVACVNTGRNFIGMETDFKYFRIAKKRIREAKDAL